MKPNFLNSLSQSLLVELGIAPGKRNRPDIEQELNAIPLEKPDEFIYGPRQMPNDP